MNNQKTNKTLKISKVAISFFNSQYRGDSKYYTTESKGRSYGKTDFSKFLTQHSDTVTILEEGNDAPRGGQTGNFVIVQFNQKFNEKFTPYFEAKKEAARLQEKEEQELLSEIEKIGDQKELLCNYFAKNTAFLTKIVSRIETSSSKGWRNWVRMECCKKIAKSEFRLFTLSAAEIRDVAFASEYET